MSKPTEKSSLWLWLVRFAAVSAVAVIPFLGALLLLPKDLQKPIAFVMLAVPLVLLVAGLGLGVVEVLAMRKHLAKTSEQAETDPADSAEVSPT